MSSLLTLDRLAAATPDGRTLFTDLTLAFGRERTGVVGRNGAGKSTLLALIAGAVEPVAGSIARAGSIRTLRQIADDAASAAQALGIADALACLARLDAGTGSTEDAGEADWTLAERLEAALGQVGLSGLSLDRSVATFSGGERTRIGIARLLLEAPDLLLLDEPTNNLDADGRAAVAALLAGWQGGAIVVSHDRDLLEQVDRIVELSPVGCTVFGGGWTAFAAQRDAERARAGAALGHAADILDQQRRAVQRQSEKKARRDKAGRAVRARGGVPRILLGAMAERAENSGGRDAHLAERLVGEAEEALANARARVELVTPLRIELPRTGLPANRTLLGFEAVTLAHGPRRLFGPLSFTVQGPERIAVRGRNGAGKTSLLRLATGEIAPTSGTIRSASGTIAMLDQHIGLLDPALDLLANLRRHQPLLSANDVHAALARFVFRNRAAHQLAGTLSGGEKLRGGLAMVLSGTTPPQLLLLDEPTNHLDLDSIETLEVALSTFDGALIVVSHDERFLEAIGVTREIAL